MPAPISDPATLARIHQNFAIAYLTDAALPLALDPGAAAALAELQASNGKEIVSSLTADERFIRSLFDGLCSGPPTTFGDLLGGGAGAGAGAGGGGGDSSSQGGGQAGGGFGGMGEATGGAAGRAAGRATEGGVVMPAAPDAEPRYVQLWGLLRELCTLATLHHPISRTRTYKTLAAAGLLGAIALALGGDYPASASATATGAGGAAAADADAAAAAGGGGAGGGGGSGGAAPPPQTSRDYAVTAQVRALDVLLCLLNHDPSIVRNACVAAIGDEAGGGWGGGRKEARGLVTQLFKLLGEGSDEGLLVQVCPPPLPDPPRPQPTPTPPLPPRRIELNSRWRSQQ